MYGSLCFNEISYEQVCYMLTDDHYFSVVYFYWAGAKNI